MTARIRVEGFVSFLRRRSYLRTRLFWMLGGGGVGTGQERYLCSWTKCEGEGRIELDPNDLCADWRK